MKEGSIYLIGGGEIKDGETYKIDEDIKSLAPKGSTFAFFGFAAQDSVAYSDAIRSVFSDKFRILIPTKKKGREYAINAINSSAVIYLGGGNTDKLMGMFSEWELLSHLNGAIKRGVHVAGMSAGAHALSSWYINYPRRPFEVKKGWGMVPICIQVHANRDSFAKAKFIWKSSDMAGAYPFVAIGERAAWCINPLGEHKVGSGDVWRSNDR